MTRKILAFLLAVIPLNFSLVKADFILSPLMDFSGGGWLSPAETTQLQGANVQRGISYNGASNELFVVDRNGDNFVRVFNGTTGASNGNLDLTGLITGAPGGTFPINMIDVGDDGVIYAANLTTAAATNLHVYRWANSAAVPTLAFSATTGYSRTGDSFAVTGSGVNTRIIASGGGSTGVALFDTVDGITFTQTPANIAANIPTGGLRLALDFIDSNTAIGKQTGNVFYTASLNAEGNPASTIGTAFNPSTLLNPNENLLAFTLTSSIPLLATLETNSNLVRLYNASDLSNLVLLGSSNLTTAFVANGNAVGDLTFGTLPDGSLRLYALNTNNGIQAFEIQAIPEPSSIALATLGVVGIIARRRQLANRKQVS